VGVLRHAQTTCRYSDKAFMKVWPGQAFEHETDHCEADAGCDGCRVAFEVARQTAISADPGNDRSTIHRFGKMTKR
jgi:hypothetical protein